MGAISGAMSKWQQRSHTFACGFMCILFAGMALLNLRILSQTALQGDIAPAGFSLGFLIFVTWAIAMQFRFLRFIVSEFRYDGFMFEFRTIGIRQTQTKTLSQIAAVKEWRGRGGPQGYRIVFQDRGKVYLSYGVTNAAQVGELLRWDISRPR
jgi:hypothetical protein